MPILVSTIIPSYNRSRDLPRSVGSALAQTYPHQEILVCDDGSTDDTADVVKGFGDRVRHLVKPNGGVSSARNFGIEHARGEAVAFLDSDDAWLPGKLAAQVEILERRPEIDMVLTSVVETDVDGRELLVRQRRDQLPRDGRILSDVLRNPMLCPSCTMVRTRVAREVGGFDTGLRTAEDIDFHLRIALRHQIAVVAEPLTRYTRAAGTLGGELRTYRDYVHVMERFLAAHGGEISARDRRDAAFGMYLRNARGLAYCGDTSGAARLAWKGARNARGLRDLAALGKLAVGVARGALKKRRAAS